MARSPDEDGASHLPTRTGGAPAQAPFEGRFTAGTILAGRYRIVAPLGRGGMGEVYSADDLKLRQGVALKLLPAGLASDPARLARFHDEVRLARQVSHPNVCRVHDIGEADGLTFLTMERVDGEDLASLLRRVGRLPAERAVPVARQICAGLAAAHERGVLHRDLKPANVMVDGRGHARLTDFGLAVVAGDAHAALKGGGTPGYMSPEQIDGRPLSERSDLYSLGLVLYELFTGRRAVGQSAPTPELDPRIERVILQCLEKDPALRPASATAVAAALAGPNALAAAIAAGETPSPEVVAAAGEATALRPGVALAMVALALAAQFVGLLLFDKLALVNRIPLHKPAEALAERARVILAHVGIVERPVDQAYGFTHDRRYIQWLRNNDRSPERWERLASGQPAAVRFWYRQSARPMTPFNDSLVVTLRDPPLESGMAMLQLDTEGRLLELIAPAQSAPAGGSGAEPRWEELLADAGLDPQVLRRSSTAWLPPTHADSVAAFEGTFPLQPAIPLRVELAAYAGRPVAFRLRGPWEDPSVAVVSPGTSIMGGVTALLVPVLLIALLVARRNDRLGRSDRRGALRIAAFVFVCDLVYAVLRYGHSRSAVREWFLFGHAAGGALFDAATVWLLYLALEPYVRRRWPQALVSWNRLMSGRFKDAMVGRDLLVAGVASAVSLALLALAADAPRWRGEAPTPMLLEAYLAFLLGLNRTLAWLFGFMVVTMVIVALMNVLLVVLLKALLRSSAAAAVVFWLLWFAATMPAWPAFFLGPPSPTQLVLLGGQVAVTTFIVVRHGLLAMAAYSFMFVLAECPALTRFGAWYAQPSMLLYLLALCMLGFGLYASLAARPFLWPKLLER